MSNQVQKAIDKYKNLSKPVKASVWFTICNVLNKGIALLATPIFVRMLTTEQYGDFTVFQSWYSILLIFTSINLFMGGFEKGIIEFKEDKDRLASSLFGLTTLITLIFFGIYIMWIDEWTAFFKLSPILMFAMFVELITAPGYEFWATQQRFEYNYKWPVIFSLSSAVGSIGLGIIMISMSKDQLQARVFSDVIVKSAISILVGVLVLYRGRCLFNKKYWLYALSFNLPLIPHFLSTMIFNQADRIMIRDIIGSSAAAVYGVAHTIGMLALMVTSAINNSFTPFCYHSMDEKKYEGIKKNMVLLVALVGLFVCGSMAFTPEIIYIFAGKKYYEAIWVIPPLAVSVFFIFLYSMFSNIEYYYKKTVYISIASIFCAVLNIVLNAIFIRLYGYYAAGYTTLACYIVFTFVHGFFCMKILRDKSIDKNELFDFKKLIIISLIVLAVMFVMAATYSNLLVRYSLLAVLCVICLVKFKAILALLNFKKNAE